MFLPPVPKQNIPSQKNGYDCGVFTCIFAEYSSREEEFDFSQAHMKYLRNRMIYEIVNAKLMLE
jgi:Ulp1 family protease